MAQQEQSKVILFEGSDPDMAKANEQARSTFKYLWREIAWERRRIVPGFNLIAVKLAFTDGTNVEHMWVGDVDFDGEHLSGELLNAPNWLENVEQGDHIEALLTERLGDWMAAGYDGVHGAYTVNLMRARMSPDERAAHDGAWGLEFGDPEQITLPPTGNHHPMALNMGESLMNFLKENPDEVHAQDEAGWTMLHREALAGNANVVEILLQHGANPKAVTGKGQTPLDLARALDWPQVVKLLA